MVTRFISKGKGKNRKIHPIRPKKGISIRSVSIEPSVVAKINKEQVKLINRGESANFSKALNKLVIRARREGIPIYDTHVNTNKRRKPYMMWIVKHPEKGDKVKGSETIVMADSYGQAIDDFIITWNKERRMKKTIGYPQAQGTGKRDFRFKRDGKYRLIKYKDFHGDDTYRLGTNDDDLPEEVKFLKAKSGKHGRIISLMTGSRNDIKKFLLHDGQTPKRAQMLTETAFGKSG